MITFINLNLRIRCHKDCEKKIQSICSQNLIAFKGSQEAHFLNSTSINSNGTTILHKNNKNSCGN